MRLIWAAAIVALPLLSQDQEPVFRAGTTLATVGFHVTRSKHYVDDLKPEDLILLEDGQPKKITFFEGGREKQRTTSVQIALLFDVSGSVVDEGLLDMTLWKNSFLDSLPGTTVAVYGFAGNLDRYCLPTCDSSQLETVFNALQKRKKAETQLKTTRVPISLPPKRKSEQGGTWIYESVIGAINDMANWPDVSGGNVTRLVVVFSDGFPTTSSVPEDAAKVARDAGVSVYPVALGHWRLVARMREIAPLLNGNPGKPNEGAERRMRQIQAQEQEIVDFASLGELTGGRSFDPPLMNSDMLRLIAGSMVGLVVSEYVAGFTPESSGGQPAKHKLVVKLASKETGKLLGGSRTVVH